MDKEETGKKGRDLKEKITNTPNKNSGNNEILWSPSNTTIYEQMVKKKKKVTTLESGEIDRLAKNTDEKLSHCRKTVETEKISVDQERRWLRS